MQLPPEKDSNKNSEPEILAHNPVWKQAIRSDAQFGKVLRALESKESEEWKQLNLENPKILGKFLLKNGVLQWEEDGQRKVVVPLSQRRRLMALYHSVGHRGSDETERAIKNSYFWPGLHTDVRNYVKSCIACSLVKGDTKGQALSFGWSIEPRALEVVHLDFCGPLPVSKQGNRYILLIIDRCTGWCELIPTPDCKAASAAERFYKSWVCSYGAPARVITDNGSHFTSDTFRQEVTRACTIPLTTISYFPQANGKAERRFREIGRRRVMTGIVCYLR